MASSTLDTTGTWELSSNVPTSQGETAGTGKVMAAGVGCLPLQLLVQGFPREMAPPSWRPARAQLTEPWPWACLSSVPAGGAVCVGAACMPGAELHPPEWLPTGRGASPSSRPELPAAVPSPAGMAAGGTTWPGFVQ